jgi:hypothetical protein
VLERAVFDGFSQALADLQRSYVDWELVFFQIKLLLIAEYSEEKEIVAQGNNLSV